MLGTVPEKVRDSGSVEQSQTPWRVWGLLYAPKLPAVKLRDLQPGLTVVIGEVDKAFADDLFKTRLEGGIGDWNRTYVAATPWQPEIRSTHTLCLHVTATDEGAALEIARSLVPSLMGVLQSVAGSPCVTRLVRVQHPVTGQSMYQTEQVFSPKPAPERFSNSETRLLAQRVGVMAAEAGIAPIAELIHEGSTFSLMSAAHTGLRIPALLAYFKALEGVVNAVLHNSGEAGSDGALSEVVNKLEHALRDQVALSERIDLVMQASSEIRALRLGHMKTRIQSVGRKLNVEPEAVTSACRFATFRNRELGHYRPELPAEAADWLERGGAFRVVQAFFGAYLDSIPPQINIVESDQ